MKSSVLFDLVATQPNHTGKRHGAGIYGEIVLNRIIERKLDVSCVYDSSKWFNPEIQKLLEDNDIRLFDIRNKSLEDIVKEGGIELIYSPLVFALWLNKFKGCDSIVTHHGIRDLELPLDTFFWRYKNVVLKQRLKFFVRNVFPTLGYRTDMKFGNWMSDNPRFRFVTVSNHSANSMKSFFPQLRNVDIPVFYSPSTCHYTSSETKYEERYYLMVSGNRWEKNNLRAIMALDRLFSMGYLEDCKVRITGAKDASVYRYSIRNSNRFIFMGYVSDEELNQLHHDSYCLIYPSLNEGFGYPPIEAMHYGVPVIASPFTSITEICQNAVLYANPYSVEELMARILYMENSEVHSHYSELGRQQFDVVTQKQNSDLDGLIDYIYR